jgi:hypothetical protein
MLQENSEMTFCIKKNNKGEYVVRFMTQVDITQAPPPPPAQTVVVYTTVPPAATTTVNQTNATTTVSAGIGGANMNVSMNVGGVSSTTTTTTTTTTTMSTSVSGGDPDHIMLEQQTQKPYVMPGYSGPVGCPYPMTDLDFQHVKETISSKSFEDSKLTIAKQVVSSTCLFASVVEQFLELFSFESTCLEFAKYAYKYTFYQGNYYTLNDAFTFESSISELNEYIENYRRP